MGGRQRGVTTQIDLVGRSKPAQTKSIAARPNERGLSLIDLCGDALHERLFERTFEEDDPGRITRERAVGESVDQAKGQPHERILAPQVPVEVCQHNLRDHPRWPVADRLPKAERSRGAPASEGARNSCDGRGCLGLTRNHRA